MGWGIFKKIKDGFNKAKKWLKGNAPKINRYIKSAKPIVKNIFNEIGNNTDNEKLKLGLGKASQYFDVASDGFDKFDQSLQSGNYDDITNWTTANIAPILKNRR